MSNEERVQKILAQPTYGEAAEAATTYQPLTDEEVQVAEQLAELEQDQVGNWRPKTPPPPAVINREGLGELLEQWRTDLEPGVSYLVDRATMSGLGDLIWPWFRQLLSEKEALDKAYEEVSSQLPTLQFRFDSYRAEAQKEVQRLKGLCDGNGIQY